MEDTAQATPSPTTSKNKLSKEERSQIMKDAAKRRWAAAKRAAAKKKTGATASKGDKAKKKSSQPREFSSALKTAEKRLAKAILERAECAAKYAVLSAEIPSLQRLVVALKNPLGVMPEYGAAAAPSLEQIVSDQPLQYANPPRIPSALPQVPMQHPVTTAGRAMGGAIGVELQEDDGEDENKFLRDSPVAGGEWH